MAQVVRYRLSRSAMRAAPTVDAAGFAAVVLNAGRNVTSGWLDNPLRPRGQRPLPHGERQQHLRQQGVKTVGLGSGPIGVSKRVGRYD
jgi:hypothetical protein